MANWSSEFKKFKLSGFCPLCGKMSLTMAIHSDSGHLMPFVTPTWAFSQAGMLFAGNVARELISLIQARACGYRKYLDLSETHRSEEFIGREERLIDNVGSQSEISRKFTVQREWSRSLKVEREEIFGQDIVDPKNWTTG